MKAMFWSCLYVTIGSVSLFFITWFLTGVYSFDRKAFAQTEGNIPPAGVVTNSDAAASPAAANPGVVTNPGSVPPPAAANPGVVTNPGSAPPAAANPGVVTNPGSAPPPSAANPEAAPPSVPSSESAPPVAADPGVVTNPEEVPAPPTISEDGTPSTESALPAAPVKLARPEIPKGVKNPTLENTQKTLDDIDKKIAEVYRMLRNYQYDSSNKRNPFSSPMEFKKEGDQPNIPSYPTGKYELSEIKLIGIKWGGKLGTGKALFQTPDNVVHTLQKNDRIGISRGIIYQLREDEVIVLQPQMVASKDEDLFIPIVIRMDRWDPEKL